MKKPIEEVIKLSGELLVFVKGLLAKMHRCDPVFSAEDVTQEILLKIIISDNYNKFKDLRYLKNWMYRTATNYVIDLCRKREIPIERCPPVDKEGEVINVVELASDSSASTPEQIMRYKELKDNCKECLDQLLLHLPRRKIIMELSILLNWSYGEISEFLGYPVSTVKQEIYLGRIQLQSCLRKKGYGKT